MKEHLSNLIGNRVRILRAQERISQEGLSFKADLHRTYIGAIERGEKSPTIDTLFKITQALNTTLSDFFIGIETEIELK